MLNYFYDLSFKIGKFLPTQLRKETKLAKTKNRAFVIVDVNKDDPLVIDEVKLNVFELGVLVRRLRHLAVTRGLDLATMTEAKDRAVCSKERVQKAYDSLLEERDTLRKRIRRVHFAAQENESQLRLQITQLMGWLSSKSRFTDALVSHAAESLSIMNLSRDAVVDQTLSKLRDTGAIVDGKCDQEEGWEE